MAHGLWALLTLEAMWSTTIVIAITVLVVLVNWVDCAAPREDIKIIMRQFRQIIIVIVIGFLAAVMDRDNRTALWVEIKITACRFRQNILLFAWTHMWRVMATMGVIVCSFLVHLFIFCFLYTKKPDGTWGPAQELQWQIYCRLSQFSLPLCFVLGYAIWLREIDHREAMRKTKKSKDNLYTKVMSVAADVASGSGLSSAEALSMLVEEHQEQERMIERIGVRLDRLASKRKLVPQETFAGVLNAILEDYELSERRRRDAEDLLQKVYEKLQTHELDLNAVLLDHQPKEGQSLLERIPADTTRSILEGYVTEIAGMRDDIGVLAPLVLGPNVYDEHVCLIAGVNNEGTPGNKSERAFEVTWDMDPVTHSIYAPQDTPSATTEELTGYEAFFGSVGQANKSIWDCINPALQGVLLGQPVCLILDGYICAGNNLTRERHEPAVVIYAVAERLWNWLEQIRTKGTVTGSVLAMETIGIGFRSEPQREHSKDSDTSEIQLEGYLNSQKIKSHEQLRYLIEEASLKRSGGVQSMATGRYLHRAHLVLKFSVYRVSETKGREKFASLCIIDLAVAKRHQEVTQEAPQMAKAQEQPHDGSPQSLDPEERAVENEEEAITQSRSQLLLFFSNTGDPSEVPTSPVSLDPKFLSYGSL